MTKSQLTRKLKDALNGEGIPADTSPDDITPKIAEMIAEAIVEYVKNPEG